MAINFDTFLKWAESRFGDVVVKGDEIKLNSIFEEDYKHHMWCSPKGGKNNLPNGVFHCWKSDQGGSLITLVMQVDKCSYEEACETLGAGDFELADLERRLEEFMSSRTPSTIEDLSQPEFVGLKFPDQTFPILSLSPDNLWRIEAEEYLKGRKLDPKNYLICVGGEYKNRIIIPYYDRDKKLIYWNGRYLTDTDKVVKYRGPSKECGVGKGDVLYISGEWPQENEEVHFSEGEFDADSIRVAELWAGALGGKGIEDSQIAIILQNKWRVVLCFDTDLGKRVDAGGEALLKIGDALIEKGRNVSYVRPPKQFKDWNKMLVSVGPKVMNAYMRREKRPFTADTSFQLRLERTL
jgi:hypothetical protein